MASLFSSTAADRLNERTSRSESRPALPPLSPPETYLALAEPITLASGADGALPRDLLPSWAQAVSVSLEGAARELVECAPPTVASRCTPFPLDAVKDDTATATIESASLVAGDVHAPQGTTVTIQGYWVLGLDVPKGAVYVSQDPTQLESIALASMSPVTVPLIGAPASTVAATLRVVASGAGADSDLRSCTRTDPQSCVGRTLTALAPGERTTVDALAPMSDGEHVTLMSTASTMGVALEVTGWVLAPESEGSTGSTPATSDATDAAQGSPDVVAGPEPSASTSSPTPSSSGSSGAPTSPSTPTPAPTTTPAPAPAPAPSNTTGGTPGDSNTGVPNGTSLTVHQGDLTITQDGTVIDSLDVRGFVTVLASNVTIRNSVIRGASTSSPRALVLVNGSGYSATIVDSTLTASTASPWINGVNGSNFTLDRVEISNVIDQVHIYGNDVVVQNSWLHDNAHFTSDPVQNGGASHDDNIQIQSGSTITIQNNALSGSHNAAIMLTQDAGKVSNLTLANNRLDNGGCTINIKNMATIPGPITLSGNTFGRTSFFSGCAIKMPNTSYSINLQNNTYPDGKAISVTL